MQEKKKVLLHGVFKRSFFGNLNGKADEDFFILEGRPGLEAAETSCREFLKRGITPTVISDNMAGFLFFKDLVKEVWMAAQMSNDDGALCNTGALILGVLAKKHRVPVYLFSARRQTKWMGRERELLMFKGSRTAPPGVRGYVPLVEWVPGQYITKTYE